MERSERTLPALGTSFSIFKSDWTVATRRMSSRNAVLSSRFAMRKLKFTLKQLQARLLTLQKGAGASTDA